MRKGTSRSRQSLDVLEMESSSSDDERREWEEEGESPLSNEIEESPMETRSRNPKRASKYASSEGDDDKKEYKKRNSMSAQQGETKIEHILMSRISSAGLEYLVLLQNQQDPFAQWIPQEIIRDFPNFNLRLHKFNTTPMKMSLYSTVSQAFEISYLSPLRILSHRPLGNNPGSDSIEFLYQLNIETGPAFFWEPKTQDSPQNLIDNYLNSRVCIENMAPERPQELFITPEVGQTYRSVDGKTPRDYQIEGVNWMLSCFCAGHGCVLADEMGLGKTIQTLVFLMHLNRYTDFHGPNLIAVRINTYNQWCSEIERWSDLRYISYSGVPEGRSIIQHYQMPYFDDKGIQVPGKFGFNILLVTYDIFLKDNDFLASIPWQNVIVDEGHRIKNCDGKKHNALIRMNAMNRIILTGTPIQNTMLELWTLLQFVSPNYFPESSIFPEDDVESLDKDVLMELKSLIAPHLMRRALADVERSIVPKDERIAFLHCTRAQEDFLRLVKMHQISRIKKGGDLESIQESNALQRICNHPFLIDGGEAFLTSKNPGKTKLELMVTCSAKFIFLDRILPIFKKQGRSVLIFSQKVKILRLLHEYCKLKMYTHETLVGTLSEQEKKDAISKFCDKELDTFIFLISTRSGAEGLNLTKANITIIFDPDWNPQNDIQALGRCHRIGQTQKVDVIRLITYGTYEHEMFARSQRKQKLWMTLLGDGKQMAAAREPPKITEVLRKPKFDSLIMPIRHLDATEFDGFASVTEVKEEEPVTEFFQIAEPPILVQNFNVSEDATFEDVMETSASVTRDIQLQGTTSQNLPQIDITHGISDEDFLKQFPTEALLTQNKKSKSRTSTQRIQIDPKTAKSIIKQIEIHGFGEWDEINKALDEYYPMEQLIRFCSVSTLLHLRACEPARISCYPLLLNQMQMNFHGFDLSMVYCSEQSEWYSFFNKRSMLSIEASVCKQIYNHIRKTAISFLSKLEHHLLIKEWCNDETNPDFSYEDLPPYLGRTREQDVELFKLLISGKDIPSKDNARTAQILVEMRSQLLRRKTPINAYKLDYWSKFEVNNVINSLRNFGTALIEGDPQTILAKTAILSKTPENVKMFIRRLLLLLQNRRLENKGNLIIDDDMSHAASAPIAAREELFIEPNDVNDVLKRIFINNLIRKALKEIQTKATDLSKQVIPQKNWITLNHIKILFERLIRYGCDALTHVLLEPEFVSNLSPEDIHWLTVRDKKLTLAESRIPDFLLSDQRFYNFLRSLLGQGKKPDEKNVKEETNGNENFKNAKPQYPPHHIPPPPPPPPPPPQQQYQPYLSSTPKAQATTQYQPQPELQMNQQQMQTTSLFPDASIPQPYQQTSIFDGIDLEEIQRLSSKFEIHFHRQIPQTQHIPPPPPPPPPKPVQKQPQIEFFNFPPID